MLAEHPKERKERWFPSRRCRSRIFGTADGPRRPPPAAATSCVEADAEVSQNLRLLLPVAIALLATSSSMMKTLLLLGRQHEPPKATAADDDDDDDQRDDEILSMLLFLLSTCSL